VNDEVEVEGAFARLADDLAALGFTRHTDGSLLGTVTDGLTAPEPVEIRESPGYPFTPPYVSPGRPMEDSWHWDPNGRLCLYTPRDSADMPWRNADVLIEHIAGWYRNEAADWPGDAPLLDLERYFFKSDRKEFLLVGENFAHGDKLTFETGHAHRCVELAVAARKAKTRNRQPLGLYIDLGHLDRPFHSWDRLRTRLDPEDAQWCEQQIRSGELQFIVLRYARGDQTGHVALDVRPTGSDMCVTSIESSTIDDTTLTLRSGGNARRLSKKRVAIVGVGAIGSFVADQLVRAGVRNLRLFDYEYLRPGNSIRHLAGRLEWGRQKVDATACVLRQHRPRPAVTATRLQVDSPATARQVFDDVDLVIDATGQAWATGLLAHQSHQTGTPMLITYCQRAGDVVRIDRVQRNEGETWLAPLNPGPNEPPAVYDNGCGDPVSPTPPSSVSAAAAATARLAIDTLTFKPIPPTTLIELVPQPDLAGDHP
jgi:hypothetical protein